jgi:hypothetical protein
VDEDVGPLEPVSNRDPPGHEDGAVDSEAAGELARLPLERALSEDREPGVSALRSEHGKGPEQGRVILLRCEAADREEKRGGRRDARLGRGQLGSRGRNRVEAVVDRLDLPGRMPCGDEEAPHGLRDGDEARRSGREPAVDVAKGPEEIAVVVVPRRDVRDAQHAGRRGAVGVGVHEVRVEQVGRRRPDSPDHVSSEAGADVQPARDV